MDNSIWKFPLLAMAIAALSQTPLPPKHAGESWPQARLDSLLRGVDQTRGLVGDHAADLEVEAFDGDRTHSTNHYKIQIHPTPQGRCVLLAVTAPPAERGNLILATGPDMWILTRRTSRPVPVSAQQRLLGDASIGDVLNVELAGRYRGEVTVNGDFLELDLEALRPGELYEKLHLRLDAATARPIESRYFSRSGRLLKTLHYVGFTNTRGRSLATQFEIRDGIDTLRRTRIHFSRFAPEHFSVGQFDRDNLRNLGSD